MKTELKIKRLSNEEYDALQPDEKRAYLAPALKEVAKAIPVPDRDKFISDWAYRHEYHKRSIDKYLTGKVNKIGNVVVAKKLLDDIEIFINELGIAA